LAFTPTNPFVMKVEAVFSSKTLEHLVTTQCRNPKGEHHLTLILATGEMESAVTAWFQQSCVSNVFIDGTTVWEFRRRHTICL
jgi:hypothetical protein